MPKGSADSTRSGKRKQESTRRKGTKRKGAQRGGRKEMESARGRRSAEKWTGSNRQDRVVDAAARGLRQKTREEREAKVQTNQNAS